MKREKKDEKTIKLTNFLINHNVLDLFLQLKYLNNINDAEFQRESISTFNNNDNLPKNLFSSV